MDALNDDVNQTSTSSSWDLDSLISNLNEEQLYSSFLTLSPGQSNDLLDETSPLLNSTPADSTEIGIDDVGGFEALTGILPPLNTAFDNNNITLPSTQLTFVQPLIGTALQIPSPSDQQARTISSATTQVTPSKQPISTTRQPVQTTVAPKKRVVAATTPNPTQLSNKKPRTATLPQTPVKLSPNNNNNNNNNNNRQASKRKEEDEKYAKRLEANKKSAQASRERKKALKAELEVKVASLRSENSELSTSITELETENKVLKAEFLHIQSLINENPLLLKLMARANMSLLPESYYHALENPTRLTPGSSTNAFWYLMVVLYTFSQYFQSLPGGNTSSVNSIPNPTSVSVH